MDFQAAPAHFALFVDDLIAIRRRVFMVAAAGCAIAALATSSPGQVFAVGLAGLIAMSVDRLDAARENPWVLFVSDMLLAVLTAALLSPIIGVVGAIIWSTIMALFLDEPMPQVRGAAVAAGVAASFGQTAGSLVTSVGGRVLLAATVGTLVYGFGRAVFVVRRRAWSRERDLEALFQRAPVALYRMDHRGRVIEANPRFTTLFGFDSAQDLLGAAEPIWDMDAVAAAVAADPGVPEVQLSHAAFTAGGMQLAVVNAINTIRDRSGSFMYHEGVITDVSEFREEQGHRQRLAAVLEATTDIVSISRGDGSVVYANPSCRSWIDEHIGADVPFGNLTDVLPHEAMRQVSAGLQADGSWVGEVEVQAASGVRYINTVVQTHRTADGVYVSGVGRDVTLDRETARRLEELVEAKDEFIASVSHELRTPLAVVIGLAAELRDRGDEFEPEEHASFIEMVAEQAQEVGDIVEDLLVAARANTDSVVLASEKIDIAEIAATTLRSFPRSVIVDVAIEGIAWADPQRVKQILRNLVSNAMRYGGPTIEVRSFRDEYHVFIDVIDNGLGIRHGDTDDIFEPYTRAHDVGSQPGSVGLGLSVSRWLARKMGGDLTYQREGNLTVFRLQLPTADRTPSAVAVTQTFSSFVERV